MKLNIVASSLSKNEWEKLLQNRLAGAFGEFCKLKFAEILEIDHVFQFDHWERETTTLLTKVEKAIFDVVTSSKFNRRRLLQRIIADWDDLEGACKVRWAKNKFGDDVKSIKRYADYRLRIDIVTFSSDLLLNEMLTRFSPKIINFIEELK